MTTIWENFRDRLVTPKAKELAEEVALNGLEEYGEYLSAESPIEGEKPTLGIALNEGIREAIDAGNYLCLALDLAESDEQVNQLSRAIRLISNAIDLAASMQV